MSPRVKRNDAPYLQIADHYRDLIGRGAISEGDPLPTVAEMAEEWDVSPGTAHKAVRQLRGEGLVTTSQQGTRVTRQRLVADVDPRESTDTVDVTEAGVVAMMPSVGAALGENADALNRTVIRRQLITKRDGRPYRLSVSWLPAAFRDAAPELTTTEVLSHLDLVADRTGRRAHHVRRHFEARTADRREAEALEVALGSPLLASAEVWSDTDGPVLYYEYVIPQKHVVSFDATE